MIQIRKSSERGHATHGWLEAYHSFSFADFYDPSQMGFRSLRVINEDRVQPGQGFGTHGHRDMEIVTYVLEGALEHKDSMGNGKVIPAGDIQYMSAGSGVRHSEFNHSKSELVHLLQIWILPEKEGEPPRYDQKTFTREAKIGQLRLLMSPTEENGSIAIRQDARLYASVLDSGMEAEIALDPKRFAWVQVTHGSLDVNGVRLEAGDGAAVSREPRLEFRGQAADSEFLLFDLN